LGSFRNFERQPVARKKKNDSPSGPCSSGQEQRAEIRRAYTIGPIGVRPCEIGVTARVAVSENGLGSKKSAGVIWDASARRKCSAAC